MKDELQTAIRAAVKELFGVDVAVELTRPDEQFGDYATNVALQLAKQVGKGPGEIAETLAAKLREALKERVSSVEVAGPGFLNLTLTDDSLVDLAAQKLAQPLRGKEVLVEFGDPNPFKSMHIGHLYSYIVGDAIASLVEAAGATVRRLSYHGDVGLHVAKAIWGMQQAGGNAQNDIGKYYAAGAKAYETDEAAKLAIDAINQQVYAQDPAISQLYNEGKDRSFSDFDKTLKALGIKTDRRYLESESAGPGLEVVKQNIGTVFTESDGAVIFEGEKVGLHTRVFITGKGLPTYETKDLGLTELKQRDYPNSAQSIIVTANEQAEYFKVMLAALSKIDQGLATKTKHLAHGFVSLSSGKMSSRTGEVYSAVNLIADVTEAMDKLGRGSAEDVKLGAIKYAFTKHRLGGDLVYDVGESLSLEGNSGPYLQYAHARACSVLAKGQVVDKAVDQFEDGERSLLRKLGEYNEAVDQAVQELMPHHVCTYLYELAQVFNRFYENNRVIGDAREAVRLQLVQAYADTLKNGLKLLGIPAPNKM